MMLNAGRRPLPESIVGRLPDKAMGLNTVHHRHPLKSFRHAKIVSSLLNVM